MLTIGYALEVMSSDRLKNSMDLPLGRRDGLMWLKWHSSFRRCSGYEIGTEVGATQRRLTRQLWQGPG